MKHAVEGKGRGPDDEPSVVPGSQADALTADAKAAKQAAKAAKAAKREAKRAAKADAKAAKRAAREERAEARAARRAAEQPAKLEAKQAKATAKAAKANAKAAAKADAKAASAAARAAKADAKAAARRAKADAKAARAAAEAARAAAEGARREAGEAEPALSPMTASARALLEEAAGLMQHAEAPAAERILEPVEPEAVEPEAVEPEPAELARPEPEPAAEPEPAEPAAQPEPAESAAEPQPERVEPEPVEAAAEREPAEPADEPEPKPAEPAEPAAEPEPEPEPAEPEAGADAAVGEPEPTPSPASAPEPEAVQAAAAVLELGTGEEPAALLAPEVGAIRVAAPEGALVAASIDVGSTSVHLLVGVVDGHRITALQDESVFLGLGDRVASEGYLGTEVRDALETDLERYVTAARDLGAATITIVATEPLRRAADAATVVSDVQRRTGAAVHVLDHEEEGLLTFLGVTGGTPVTGELLLADIGGGSSEFVSVRGDGHVSAVGIQLGANRLTRELVQSDPPTLAEIEALRAQVARLMAGAPDASPTEIVAVGGTASNLLRLLPATAVDRALTRRRIAVALAMLTVQWSGDAATRHLIRPERARILPAGAVIVDAILERYGADRLRVSEAGLREGAILAAVHGGAAWRDRLTAMARGWAESGAGG